MLRFHEADGEARRFTEAPEFPEWAGEGRIVRTKVEFCALYKLFVNCFESTPVEILPRYTVTYLVPCASGAVQPVVELNFHRLFYSSTYNSHLLQIARLRGALKVTSQYV